MFVRCQKDEKGRVMLVVSCNWCGFTIVQIAYTVTTIKVMNNEPLHKAIPVEHVHWDCLPMWVEYMRGGPNPPILDKETKFNPLSVSSPPVVQ